MNVYLCSTVRHLMFSILNATKEPIIESTIVVILDQQNLKKTDFDTSVLPSHINIIFINRKKILSKIYQGFSGVILKLCAVCNVETGTRLKKITRKIVFEKNLDVFITDESELFLFNDRNRLSRLFRLSFDDYSVIEDGLSNYSGIKLSLFDRIKKLFNGNKNKYRYIGDDNRCKNIFLLDVNKAPMEIAFKSKDIDFIDTDTVVKYCQPFFKLDKGLDKNIGCILATQPISIGRLSKSNDDLVIYSRVIEYLKNKNITIALKVHPRESVERYREFFDDTTLITGKAPLELVVFCLKNKPDILSIYSTAGLGFEQYCTRKTLIQESEVLNMEHIFMLWKSEIDQLDTRLEKLL